MVERLSRIKVFGDYLIPNIDIWMFNLENITIKEAYQAEKFLSYREQHRIQKFVFHSHCCHFVMRRMLMKIVLGRYTGVEPENIHIAYGPHKKPYLEDHTVYFNTSHTSTRGVIAINQQSSIGIDIESIKPIEDRHSILEQFASPNEQAWVENSLKRFLILWTIKEAIIKQQGTGFLINTIPQLDKLPTEIKNKIFISQYQDLTIYSKKWANHVISVCF